MNGSAACSSVRNTSATATGYRNTLSGMAMPMIVSSPRFDINRPARVNPTAHARNPMRGVSDEKNAAVDAIRPTAVVKQASRTMSANTHAPAAPKDWLAASDSNSAPLVYSPSMPWPSRPSPR